MDPIQPTTTSSKTQTEVGYVTSSRAFMVYLDGLPNVQITDLVESNEGLRGWVNALLADKVEVLMLDEGKISPGQMFKRLPERLGVEVGPFLLGRAINPLGVPIDGKGLLKRSKEAVKQPLEAPALGIEYRQFINSQFITGISLIDTLIPIGRGQRELVMGDAHSGKTSFLIDLIVNQRKSGVICIYASIGKPVSAVRSMIDILAANKALSYTIVIATSSSEPAPLILLTPKTALTVAEFFQNLGKDVLLILDDMGNHAKIYREISLLGDKSPGRESYPGDIFYQHAHLLERAGSFKKEAGGGSITALPVIELNLSDFTTLIPTNLMSMTDGHLLFRSNLHNLGQRPAIDIGLSVSRVGRQTQPRIPNLLSGRIRLLLSQAEELETVSRFSSELPFQSQLILKQKRLLDETLKQEPLTFIPAQIQAAILGLIFTTFIQDKDRYYLERYKSLIIQAFATDPPLIKVVQFINSMKSDKELIDSLEKVVPRLNQLFPNIK